MSTPALGLAGLWSSLRRPTKDDLEPGRQEESIWDRIWNAPQGEGMVGPSPLGDMTQPPPAPPAQPGIADVMDRQRKERERVAALQNAQAGAAKDSTPPPDTSYIRFAVPQGPDPLTGRTAMGPLGDYDPDEGAPFLGQGGLGSPGTPGAGAIGHPGGGAFSGSSTPVTGRDAMGAPTFDWSGVANPDAFEAYSDPIRHALMKAEQTRAEALAQDPMWEEKQKAEIMKNLQVGIQSGIWNALQVEEDEALKGITQQVMRAMPGASPEELKREIQSRMDEWKAGRQGLRLPSSYPMPSTMFASGAIRR